GMSGEEQRMARLETLVEHRYIVNKGSIRQTESHDAEYHRATRQTEGGVGKAAKWSVEYANGGQGSGAPRRISGSLCWPVVCLQWSKSDERNQEIPIHFRFPG